MFPPAGKTSRHTAPPAVLLFKNGWEAFRLPIQSVRSVPGAAPPLPGPDYSEKIPSLVYHNAILYVKIAASPKAA